MITCHEGVQLLLKEPCYVNRVHIYRGGVIYIYIYKGDHHLSWRRTASSKGTPDRRNTSMDRTHNAVRSLIP